MFYRYGGFNFVLTKKAKPLKPPLRLLPLHKANTALGSMPFCWHADDNMPMRKSLLLFPALSGTTMVSASKFPVVLKF